MLEIFATLNEVLDEKRALWGRRVKLLVLRPPGELYTTMSAAELNSLVHRLLEKATESGANSICFAATIQGEELRLTVSDNGWAFATHVLKLPLCDRNNAKVLESHI